MTFLSLIKSYRKKIVSLFFCIFLSNILALALPWGIKILIDEVFVGKTLHLLNIIIVALLGILILRSRLNFLRQYHGHMLGEKIICRLRERIYDQSYALPLAAVKKMTPSQILTRMTGDLDSLRKFLFGEVIEFIYAVFSVGLILAALVFINFKLTIISLLTFPLFLKIYARLLPELKDNYRIFRDVWGRLTSRINEVLNGMTTVRALTGQTFEKHRFWTQQKDLLQTAAQSHSLNARLWVSVEFFSSIGILAILWVGGMDVMNGNMTAGELIAFYSYLGMLFTPLIRMVVIQGSYQEASAALERINEVLEVDHRIPEVSSPVNLSKIRGVVEFKNVSFGYSPHEEVLHNIDFLIEEGETVGIAGASGVGKTTMINLLLRFYDPWAGKILIDGRPLKKLDLDTYRKQVAVVLQDDFLFSGTIQENICYGQSNVISPKVIEAARAACADEFINKLPKGYFTEVGERGVYLSSGQRQRIAIARALLRNPSILILDEATSAVDALTENRIQESIRKIMRDKTVIIVAHRFSTIMEADKIIVLDKGKIVETGDHNYLLNKGGFYSNLYFEQFTSPDKEQLQSNNMSYGV